MHILYTFIHIHTNIHIFTHLHIFINIYTYLYTFIHIYTHLYISIHIYTHSSTSILKKALTALQCSSIRAQPYSDFFFPCLFRRSNARACSALWPKKKSADFFFLCLFRRSNSRACSALWPSSWLKKMRKLLRSNTLLRLLRVSFSLSLSLCVYTYMHTCMHAYMHTYIHTYIYVDVCGICRKREKVHVCSM